MDNIYWISDEWSMIGWTISEQSVMNLSIQ